LNLASTEFTNKYEELITELDKMGQQEFVQKFKEYEQYFIIMTTDDYIASQTDKHPDGECKIDNKYRTYGLYQKGPYKRLYGRAQL